MSDVGDELLLKAVTRRYVRVAVLKDEKAFEEIRKSLQDALTQAFDEGMRQGIVQALDRLAGMDPGAFTQDDADIIVRALENQIGPAAFEAAARKPVLDLSELLGRLGAEEVGQAAGVGIRFGRPDLLALDVIATGNLYWVGNSWNTYTLNTIQAVLKDYFTEGMTRDQLTERLAKDFAGMADRSRHYWELLADHIATKTREMGRVTGYEQAGIAYVQVRAHLDSRTTPICKKMHGTLIAVSALRKQTDEYLAASGRKDFQAAKDAWTMHKDDADLDHIDPNNPPPGTAGPPYHFRCRTITVAYFGAPP